MFQDAKEIYGEIDRLNMGLISAGIGFFALLALFPALAAIIMIWGFFADPSVIGDVASATDHLLPAVVQQELSDQMLALISSSKNAGISWTTLFTIGLSFWSASAGVTAVMRGLDAVFGVTTRRRWIAGTVRASLLTLAMCVLALVVIAAVLIVPVLLALVPVGPLVTLTAELARWAIAVTAVCFAFVLLYRYGPNLPPPPVPWVTPGAILATLLWLGISVGLSVYFARFANYNHIYGSLGGAVAVLVWAYLSSFAVLIGGALNAIIRRKGLADTAAGQVPSESVPGPV